MGLRWWRYRFVTEGNGVITELKIRRGKTVEPIVEAVDVSHLSHMLMVQEILSRCGHVTQ